MYHKKIWFILLSIFIIMLSAAPIEGTGLRSGGPTDEGQIDLSAAQYGLEFKLTSNGIDLTNGGTVTEGDFLSGRLDFKFPKGSLTPGVENILTYDTGVPLAATVSPKNFALNGNVVGTYEIGADGRVIIKIKPENVDSVNNLDNATGFVSFDTTATVTEKTKDREFIINKTGKTVTIKALEDLNIRKIAPKYRDDLKELYFKIEIKSSTGTEGPITLKDQLKSSALADGLAKTTTELKYKRDSFKLITIKPDGTKEEAVLSESSINFGVDSNRTNCENFQVNLPALTKGYSYQLIYTVQHGDIKAEESVNGQVYASNVAIGKTDKSNDVKSNTGKVIGPTNIARLSKELWKDTEASRLNEIQGGSTIKYDDIHGNSPSLFFYKITIGLNDEERKGNKDIVIKDTLPEGMTFKSLINEGYNDQAAVVFKYTQTDGGIGTKALTQASGNIDIQQSGQVVTITIKKEGIKSYIDADPKYKEDGSQNRIDVRMRIGYDDVESYWNDSTKNKTNTRDYKNTVTVDTETKTHTSVVKRDDLKPLEKNGKLSDIAEQIIEYELLINPDGKKLETTAPGATKGYLILEDILTDDQANVRLDVINSSVKVYNYNGNPYQPRGTQELIGDSTFDSKGVYSFKTDGESKLEFHLPDEQPMVLVYQVKAVRNEGYTGKINISNTAILKGIHESKKEIGVPTVSSAAGLNGEYNLIYLNKVEKNKNHITLKDAIFQVDKFDVDLLGSRNPVWKDCIKEYITDENGRVTLNLVTDLIFEVNKLYRIKEKMPPTGYNKSTEEIYFVRMEKGATIDSTIAAMGGEEVLNAAGANKDQVKFIEYIKETTWTYENELKTIDIKVNKKWEGPTPENTSVIVKLLVDREVKATIELSEANGWEHTFTDLRKVDANGNEISYKIEEVSVANYRTEITGDAEHGFTITNTPNMTEIKVSKVWDDANNQDGKRLQSVTVKLLGDGVDTGDTVELNETNNWQAHFTNLDEYKYGQKIVYTVEEVAVGNGYTTKIVGDAASGFTVINSRTPEVVEIKGRKTWHDDNNRDGKRPNEITIRLLADGIERESKVVKASDNWEWSFKDFPKYENGSEINYTISEVAVEGYSTKVDGYDVENSYTPGKISIQVTKAWQDGNDQDKVRPDSVKIQLFANGQAVAGKTLTLSKDKHWTDSFVDLAEYQDGVKINYEIKEEAIGHGYTTVITGDAISGYVVTNSRTPNPPNPLPPGPNPLSPKPPIPLPKTGAMMVNKGSHRILAGALGTLWIVAMALRQHNKKIK